LDRARSTSREVNNIDDGRSHSNRGGRKSETNWATTTSAARKAVERKGRPPICLDPI
jgi:DNA-directed RNA polymerase beta' subunit